MTARDHARDLTHVFHTLLHGPGPEGLSGRGGATEFIRHCRSGAWPTRRIVMAGILFPAISVVLGVALHAMAALVLGPENLPFAMRAGRARDVVILGSLLLAILAIAGTALALRHAWRTHRSEQVKAIYRLATDDADEAFYMLRAVPGLAPPVLDFIVEDCNGRAAAFAGVERNGLVGARLSAIDGGANACLNLAVLRQAMALGSHEDEFRISRFGQLQATWMHRRILRAGAGLAVTLRDVTATRSHEQALSRMANADALTKLPNRHWLAGFLPGALARAETTGSMLALLVIDLDDFKNINDTLGHAAGDCLLQAAAFRIRSTVRPSSPVVRLGGDEFTVVLEQLGSVDDAARIAARLIDALAERFALHTGETHALHASIGISVFPRDGAQGDLLMKHAEIAMHAVKEHGKAHFLFYQPHLSETLVGRLGKEAALRHAIEDDQFVVYYQPRVNAVTGLLCSMEALVRWEHPERGIVSPGEFIPLAEETGLIVPLGAKIVDKTCAQLAAWKAAGLPLVPVSINVSSRQFAEVDVQALFVDAMTRHRLEAELIEIELTESCMMGEADMVIRDMRALQERGIKLLIDDFGTGYSSLSQLQRMNFDVLKVDMAFTSALGRTDEATVFVKAIVWMAHALGMSVVAEGVESHEQLAILQGLACDEIQGFLVSRPVPAREVELLMKKRYLFDASATIAGAAYDCAAMAAVADARELT